MGVTGIAAAGRTRRTGCGARAGRGCKLAERWPRAAGLHKAAGARVRRARSRAERRAGLAGTLPLFCTQRWASANCRTQRADMGRRALESWRPLERRLSMARAARWHTHLAAWLRVGHGGPSEDGSGTRSSRRSASAGEARVSRAVATLAGVAGRSSRPPAGRRFWTGLEAVERGVGPIDFPIEFPMAADPCLWAAGRAIYR